MKKAVAFYLAFVFACTVFFSGCVGPFGPKPSATPTAEPAVVPTATAGPTALPTVTATVEPTPTSTPSPSYAATPFAEPPSAPIYTVSCTFSPLILDSTSTVITDISGNITNVDTGDRISGNANDYTYQFSHVPSGSYDLAVDVQYTVYYMNDTTADRSTRIADSFGVNGNVDKIYPLY